MPEKLIPGKKARAYQGKRGSCINSKKPGIGKRIPGDSLHDRTGAGKCGTYDDTADGSWNPKLKNGNLRRIGPVRLQNRLQGSFSRIYLYFQTAQNKPAATKRAVIPTIKIWFFRFGSSFSPQSPEEIKENVKLCIQCDRITVHKGYLLIGKNLSIFTASRLKFPTAESSTKSCLLSKKNPAQNEVRYIPWKCFQRNNFISGIPNLPFPS